MSKKMNVMVFAPGEDGVMQEIDDSLESMQKIVGGYIEQVTLAYPLAAICNEYGKLDGRSESNRWGFVGTFFMTRCQDGEYVSLTEGDLCVIERLVEQDVQLVL